MSCAFIRQHAPWVRRQAQALVRHLPANVERSDLVQVSPVAVAQSALTFTWDGDRDTAAAAADAFVRYARMRVKGAMLDELRSMDFLSRGDRRKMKRLQIARERYRSTHGIDPAPPLLAGLAGVGIDEIPSLLQADQFGRNQVDVDDGDGLAQRLHPCTPRGEVEDQVGHGMVYRQLGEFLAARPARERLVFDAYMGLVLTPIETAAALGVTPSRVWHMFNALLRLISAQPWATPLEVACVEPPCSLAPPTPLPMPQPRLVGKPAAPRPAPADLRHLFSADIVRGCGVELLR